MSVSPWYQSTARTLVSTLLHLLSLNTGEMENDEITAEVTETKETEAEKDEDNSGLVPKID